MARLEVLDDVERLADGYLVLNVLSSIAFNLAGIYAVGHLLTYTMRLLGCC